MKRIKNIALILGILYGSLIPCTEPLLCLDCSSAVDLGCITSAVVSGDTTGGTNTADRYYCVTWPETGPEDIYIVHPDMTCDLSAELSAHIVDLDLFILTRCDELANCAFGNESATYYDAPPGTYYIVVDGYDGAEGSYTLHITSCCSATFTPIPTSTPAPTATVVPAVYPSGKSCILFLISFICILFLIPGRN